MPSFTLFTFGEKNERKVPYQLQIMRFPRFYAFLPLTFQRCLFQVGSYSFNDQKMIFLESPRVKGYVETSRSIVLDYDVKINPLKLSDRILNYGSLGNYSLAGFEMILHRYVSHYIITYYLPSGRSRTNFFSSKALLVLWTVILSWYTQ